MQEQALTSHLLNPLVFARDIVFESLLTINILYLLHHGLLILNAGAKAIFYNWRNTKSWHCNYVTNYSIDLKKLHFYLTDTKIFFGLPICLEYKELTAFNLLRLRAVLCSRLREHQISGSNWKAIRLLGKDEPIQDLDSFIVDVRCKFKH